MTEPRESLPDRVARGPVVLDAAMGTRLVALGLDLTRDDPCLWVLSNPGAVLDLHARDLAAGADAVLTNTFGANRHWLDHFGRGADAAEINRRATALARRAAGADRFVIGSIGPTASADPASLREQVEALEGVDALLFETQTPDQALAALAATSGVSVPRVVSLFDWPAAPGDLAARFEGLGAWALGVNCVVGMRRAVAAAEGLAGVSRLPLLVKPSACLPGEEAESPSAFAAAVPALLALGVRLVGGCCGTTEEHVAALRGACYDASRGGPGGTTGEGQGS